MAGGAKRIKSPASGNSGSDVLIDVLIQVYSFFKMQSLKQKKQYNLRKRVFDRQGCILDQTTFKQQW